MVEESFKSERKSVGMLLVGTNRYEVPSHQRDYSWGIDEIEDFWNDLISSTQEKDYFFGSMIFQNSSDEKVKIILDGQQRLVTITILLAVVRDIFYTLRDTENVQSIEEHFIIDKYFKKEVKKLILNLRNKDFFYYCIQKSPNDQEKQDFKEYEKKNRLPKTNKLLRNAYYIFKEKIEKELKNKEKPWCIEFLTKLISTITDKFIIIMITVGSEEEAYMIFETINDRGLELSVADLFKNYLIRKAPPGEKNDVVRIWQEISSLLDDKIRPFLRHYWLSKFQMTTERKLFSVLKEYVETGKSNVRNFVKDLKEEATIYSALLNPDVQYWEDIKIVSLLEDFNVLDIKQCLPLLMSGNDKFNKKNFIKLIEIIINFSFRYSTICNLHNNILERKYSDISKKIRNGIIKTVDEVKDLLLDIYPDDKQFVEAFKVKEIKNSSIARCILSKIDLAIGSYQEMVDYSTLSSEHILPKSPQESWGKYLKSQGIDGKDIKEIVNRIGNLTLLDVKMNNEASNLFFIQKRDEYYRKSHLKINEKLKVINDWNKNSIIERQTELAEIAKNVWKI